LGWGFFADLDPFDLLDVCDFVVRWKKDLDPKPAADKYQDPQKKAAQKKADPISFSLEGARNVALETIKRGEDDFDLTDGDNASNHVGVEDGLGGKKTVILRLYERLGGHASVRLNV
jgi:alpha-mannosidase